MNDARILQRLDKHLRPKLKHRNRATRRFAATVIALHFWRELPPV